MTTPAEAIQVPDLLAAVAEIRALLDEISEFEDRRARFVTSLEETAQQQITALQRQLEDALRDAGRQRARADALEAEHQPAEASPVVYLLWSQKTGAWWRPGAWGYTDDIGQAGRFSQADAVRHVVASAQSGVRDQVSFMVAAPDYDGGGGPF